MGRDVDTARRGISVTLIAVVGAVVLVVAAVVVIVTRRPSPRASEYRAEGLPANVSTAIANVMGLSALPNAAAPGFTLADQHGRTLSLASFRGRAVVLDFMDPHCTDICPIVSHEFVDAYHDLGAAASHVVFMAVNVNPLHAKVADVASFSQSHGLDAIPSWHFFTGSTKALRATWERYNVSVQIPNNSSDIVHSSLLYFIGPTGHERFLASPSVKHTKAGVAYLPAPTLTAWARGISLVAGDLAQ